MGKNILDPFYKQLTEEKVIKFGVCIDEWGNLRGSPNHKEKAEELIRAGPDFKTAFLGLLWELLLWNKRKAEMHLRAFMKLSLNEMPLYIIEYPNPVKKVMLCPPPIPGRGPLGWQVILSRWRLIVRL